MAPHQRHNSDPFVCHENLLITECTMCLRRGSASLVEMLQCRARSLTEAKNLSPCLFPPQDLASSDISERPVHATDYPSLNNAQNTSLLSPLLSPHTPHDSASHFDSPRLSPNLQPPSELHLSVPLSPQPHRHHCKACMSHFMKDRKEGGGSLGHTHKHTFATSAHISHQSPASPHRSRSSPATPLPVLTHSQSSQMNPLSPSRAVLPPSMFESRDLSLLNYCLHHIVSRRTSSPTLFDRGSVNHPLHSHGEISSPLTERIEKRQSLDIPFCCSPNLDRKLLLSPPNSEGRPDILVG